MFFIMKRKSMHLYKHWENWQMSVSPNPARQFIIHTACFLQFNSLITKENISHCYNESLLQFPPLIMQPTDSLKILSIKLLTNNVEILFSPLFYLLNVQQYNRWKFLVKFSYLNRWKLSSCRDSGFQQREFL